MTYISNNWISTNKTGSRKISLSLLVIAAWRRYPAAQLRWFYFSKGSKLYGSGTSLKLHFYLRVNVVKRWLHDVCFLVSIILVLKSCYFFPSVRFKRRRNYALWRRIISVHPYSCYGFGVLNILNEILLSNLLLPSWLNRREQSFLKLRQMRIAFWIDSEKLVS